MRISAPIGYNPIQYNPYIKTKRITSFNGNKDSLETIESGYTETEIEYAKMYMRVKNADKLIRENMDTTWLIISSPDRAIELLKKYRAYESAQGKKLENLSGEINKIDKRRTQVTDRDKEIIEELSKTGIKNAIDKIKLTKVLTQEKRKKQVFRELNSKYIALDKLEQKSYPNAIMIKGMDDKSEQEEVIKYLRKNNCEVYILNFDHIPLETVHKEINNCAKKIKNSGKHSIITIENFDKYTIPTEENFNFINKFKKFLCTCSKNNDTTVLVFESNPERLDENIIGKHRFQKEIDVRNIKSDNFCEIVQKYDGYSLIYDDNEDSHIDLYLANFGLNKYTLWIDTDNPNKIRKALDNIDKIREIPLFKDVRSVQSPRPDSFSPLDEYMYYPESHLTMDYKPIYSYLL